MPTPDDPLETLRSPGFIRELQRKAIHLSFIVLPLVLLHPVLPWPHTKGEFRFLFVVLVLAAIAIDLFRIHERRFGALFRTFFGELVREHERFNLLGSTYLLLAALLAIEMFPLALAGAALGFTVLGDAFAAIVGKVFGRRRFFGKTLEGAAGGLLACLVWAGFLVAAGHVPMPIAVAGALTASLVEMLPIPLDDNLGVTLGSGFTMWMMWQG